MKLYQQVLLAVGVGVLCSPAVFAAASDHVSQVLLTQGVRYEAESDAGPWYVFTLEVDTDATVIEIQFTTPAGYTYIIPAVPSQYNPWTGVQTSWEYFEDDDVWEWEYEIASEYIDPFEYYGDGDYQITVFYAWSDPDQITVPFRIAGTDDPLPQPTQVPLPIEPVHNTDVASPVAFAWQPCTDPAVNAIWVGAERTDMSDEVGVDWLIGPDQTQWGPAECSAGRWQAELTFYHAQGPIDAQGVECWVGKYTEMAWSFSVGGPFPIYEVWAGHTDYVQEPENWNIHYNIHESDYVRLGGSDGYTATFKGSYPYYILVVREPLLVDCIKGSDGNCYMGPWVTGNLEDGWALWSHDEQYAILGAPTGSAFIGFIRVENPGHWDAVTIVTDKAIDCPDGDVTGDCFVDLQDLAVLAADWLTGTRIIY